MRLISGSSNKSLALALTHELDIPLVQVELSNFGNGEKRVWIQEHLDGQDIVLVQSFSSPVDTQIIECLLLIDALERLGAKDIHLVIPWMGYSLQDKVFREGEPIAAKVIASLLSKSHLKRIHLLDLHNSSITGFFDIPSTHISAMPLFIDLVRDTFTIKNSIVASPDFGGLKRARQFATQLGLDLVNIDKHRNLKTGEVSAVGLHGDVNGKTVFVYDDIIMGGSTVTESAELLKKEGAKKVHFFATHGLFVGNALEKLNNSSIDSIYITNSVEHQKLPSAIKSINIAPLLAQVLKEWF